MNQLYFKKRKKKKKQDFLRWGLLKDSWHITFAVCRIVLPSSNISIKMFFQNGTLQFYFQQFLNKSYMDTNFANILQSEAWNILYGYFTSIAIKLSNFSPTSCRSFLLVFRFSEHWNQICCVCLWKGPLIIYSFIFIWKGEQKKERELARTSWWVSIFNFHFFFFF